MEMMENVSRSSESVHELVTGSHHFTVTGYSLIKGSGPRKFRASNIFNVGGYEWVVLFYPDGFNPKDLAAYVSVFIAHEGRETDVRTHFEIMLKDQSGKGKHLVVRHQDTARTFKRWKHSECGFDQFCRKDVLESSDYLKNDTLEIKCTIKVIKHRLKIPRPDYIEIPPSNMGNEFKYLFDSGFGADITFSVGDEKFKAHKLILSARSSIFKSQFVENPDLNEVEIVDIEPAVFKLMLEYVYSSDLPNTHEFTTFTNTMHHLMVAAVCYDLDRLRLFCEAKLSEEIIIDSVATTLRLAEQHGCLQLKALCIKFVVTHLEAVKESKDFRLLKESCPSFISEILEDMCTSSGPNTSEEKVKEASS